MEPIASMLQQTGQHVVRQREALVGHTRNATRAFATETKSASNDLARFVRSEAKRWQRYADQATQAALGSLAPRAIERRLLTHVDSTLRALDARVRTRLSALDKKPRAPAKTARHPKTARKQPRKVARANGAVTLAG